MMTSLLDKVESFLKEVTRLNEFARAFVTIAAVYGAFSLLKWTICTLIELGRGFRLYVLSQYCCRLNLASRYGTWALITGGGDGLGRAMAVELARAGMSIIIVDWSNENLATTKGILESEANVGSIITIQADLADSTQKNFDNIRAQIKPDERDIGVLINNVGTLPYRFARFGRYTMEPIVKMVNLNALATVHMTRMILPGMLHRERGLIVNVSSLSASIMVPFCSLYGSTKCLVSAFTRQLQIEYHSQPIDFVLLEPGPMRTKLSDPDDKLGSSLFVIQPEIYAKSVIRALSARPKMYSGIMTHGILRKLLLFLDEIGLLSFIYKNYFKEQEGKDLSASSKVDLQRQSPQENLIHYTGWKIFGLGVQNSKQDPYNA